MTAAEDAKQQGGYPLLKEVAPARKATKARPAAGPVYTTRINGGAAPTMPGGTTLYELFRCAGAGGSWVGGAGAA